jgi:predicted ATP-grasp superfamily ATP-dependent carboligase
MLFPFYVPSPHRRAEVISNTLSVGVATRAIAGESMVDEIFRVYAVQFQPFHPDVSHYVQAVRLVILEYVAVEFHPCLAVIDHVFAV